MQPTTIRRADGKEETLPKYEKHMLSDAEGWFPEDFNTWETDVLNAELKRSDSVAWYRNPSRASQDSLGVTYEDGHTINMVRPDFIFFAQLPDSTVVADIIDPHGTQFSDSIPKLRGLARYAATAGKHYRRIDAVAKVDDVFKVLDLKEVKVREAIESATSINELYSSNIAANYV